jgi:glycosyltransferase involved in cell wall biosynthesis
MPPKKNSSLVVVLLDPRGTILSGGLDVIQRIKNYGVELSRCDSELKLLVFSSHAKSKDFNSTFSDIICLSKPTFNAPFFAIRVRKYLMKKNLKCKLLIASDPWESFWSAFLLNKLSSNKAPIQIQVHGDIANPVWKKISIRNRIRFYLAKISMNKAQGIRAVGHSQANQVSKIFKIKKVQISVIPVSINNLRLTSNDSPKRPKTLGLIGRIHTDRGIYNFINLIKSLSAVRDDFSVTIAGAGPDKDRLLNEIKELLPESKIRFLAHLTSRELEKVWNEIGVLVSTAPAESYGRAMREALVAGVPVWATESSGVEDLILKAGKDVVKILDLNKSNHDLSVELDQLLKIKVALKFRKQFINDNSTYAKLLAKSWVELISNQR